jgi:hypothetical protein
LRCNVEESSGSALRPAAFSAWLARCLWICFVKGSKVKNPSL